MVRLYDTHLHLDLQQNRGSIVEQIVEKRIYTIAVTNLPPLYEKLVKEIDNKYIQVALGLHPELIGQYHKYIPDMWRLLPNARYIGEVGIDLKVGKTDRDIQITFFEELIDRCSGIGGKILTVHSRSAVREVLSIFGDDFNGNVILHWFSGTKANLEKAVSNGFYFSVNYAMTQSKSGQRLISSIPNNRILLETDSPFVARKGLDYSQLIYNTIKEVAAIKGVDVEDMSAMFWRNFRQLLE